MNNKRTKFPIVEEYMHKCMGNDSAHDTEHIYRVLNYALDIAKYEGNRKLAAKNFYESLLTEVRECYSNKDVYL